MSRGKSQAMPRKALAKAGLERAEQLFLLLSHDFIRQPKPAVLAAARAAGLEPAMLEAGYRVVGAATPEAANALLKQDEELTFVIMDIADGTTLDAAAAELGTARLAIAWCRLPAIVLLPAKLAGAEEALRERGMLSPCLAKPIDIPRLVKHIRQRQAY